MKPIFTIVFLSLFTITQAQYYDFTSFYWNTYSSLNPAYSGFNSKSFLNVQLLSENSRHSDNPTSIWVNSDLKIKAIHGALGVSYNQFDNFLNHSKTLKLNYNYQLELNQLHKLSFGLSLGVDQFKSKANQFTIGRYQAIFPIYWEDYQYTNLDVTRAKLGAGMMYRFKQIEMGLSVTNHIEANPYRIEDASTRTVYQEWNVYNSSVVHFYTNYRFSINKWLEMNPIFAYQHLQGSNFSAGLLDINFIFKEVFLIGAQFTANQSNINNASLLLGLELSKKFQFNYAYGATISRLTNEPFSRHELGLAYIVR